MADKPSTDVHGLQLSNNSFGNSPPGSLAVADNCVMPQAGVIEPRRGQARAYIAPDPAQISFAQCEFKGSLIINSATDKFSDYTLGVAANPTIDFTGGPWNPVDSSPDAGAPAMKFGFAGDYLQFCTTTGPKVRETLAGQPRAAGLQRMEDPTIRMLSLTTDSHGWLPYKSSVAYRTLLRRPTDDGTSLLSPPSGRAIVTNRILAPIGAMVRTGGTTVTVTIPGQSLAGGTGFGLAVGDTFTLTPGETNFAAGAYTVASTSGIGVFTYASAGANVANTVAQDFDTGPRAVHVVVNFDGDVTTATPWRLYRSRPTSSSSVGPSDELFLVNEDFPTSGQVTAGLVSYNDTTPDSVISDPLYTNPQTGEGPTQANYPPPLYRDTTNWGQRQWFAQTTAPQAFNLQMLGVGTPDGVQANDTITLSDPESAGGFTLTFKATASVVTEVSIVSDDVASVNILRTAQHLVTALNTNFASNNMPIVAYYNSAQNEAPGKILLQRTAIVQHALTNDAAFSVVVSRPASWVPALSSSVETWSSQEYKPNGLAFSKLDQSEAVPPVNFTTVGSKNYPIARVVGLQNSLLVFKKGDGVYSVSGQFPFQVLQISTANIIATDACSVFADNAWVYTDQGFLRISDSGGSSVVSRPIETELNRLHSELPDMTSLYSFTVPYETERRILLFVPFAGDDNTAPPTLKLKAWCYNNATQAWTGPLDYDRAFSGVVGLVANRLTLGIYDSSQQVGRITEERKGNGYLDYADASDLNTIAAVDVGGNPLVIEVSSADILAAGDGIVQGQWATKIKKLRPDLGPLFVELYEDVPFAVGLCDIYQHYDVALQFLPQGDPTGRHVLTRLQLLFKQGWFAAFGAQAILMTDQLQADLEVPIPSTGFGLTPFGGGPFGNPTPLVVDVNPISSQWTTAAQYFIGVELSEVWCKMRMQGFGAAIDNASGPAGRGR